MNHKMLNKGTVLILDDEPNTIKVISAILKKEGYDVHPARSAEEALDKVTRTAFDAVISDYKLPGINGIQFIDALNEKQNDIPVVMLTAYGTIEKAVEAMKKGAFNYLVKPLNPEELITVIREAITKHRLIVENTSLKSQLKERFNYKNIIGKSIAMQELYSLIDTVAKSDSNILITGESGTGKELFARAIHIESLRVNEQFIPIDCTSLSEQLLESELFGVEKGAFTGAYERKKGRIEIANGGTVFLDEIGELPLSIQKKLLRFIQEREFVRVGGNTRIKIDVRIIAATNRNLEDDVKSGNFREDLFYRLNVVKITIPPLRERKEDIQPLALHFLSKFNQKNNKSILTLDSDVLSVFMDYDWPGNVRELENVIERAVVLCQQDIITIKYLPKSIRELHFSQSPKNEYDLNLIETEKRLLLRALEKTSWNQTRSAMILGISRKQLRTKMKHHGLLPEE